MYSSKNNGEKETLFYITIKIFWKEKNTFKIISSFSFNNKFCKDYISYVLLYLLYSTIS